MTSLERQLRAFALRALLAAAGNPLSDARLKGAVRDTFVEVAFAEEQLDKLLTGLKTDGLTQATDHPVLGPMWSLTLKGTSTAQQLG